MTPTCNTENHNYFLIERLLLGFGKLFSKKYQLFFSVIPKISAHYSYKINLLFPNNLDDLIESAYKTVETVGNDHYQCYIHTSWLV